MGSISEEFFSTSMQLDHPIALEPEGGGGGDSIAWDTMGWGYWTYPQVGDIHMGETITHVSSFIVVCGTHVLGTSAFGGLRPCCVCDEQRGVRPEMG